MNDDTPTATPPACLACGQGSEDAPLICLEFRGAPLWICPQHMPLLIHQPEQLVGRLPDAGASRVPPSGGASGKPP